MKKLDDSNLLDDNSLYENSLFDIEETPISIEPYSLVKKGSNREDVNLVNEQLSFPDEEIKEPKDE